MKPCPLYSLRVTGLSIICFFSGISTYSALGQERINLGQKRSVVSGILDKEIRLSIHLPDGYDDSTDRYPVLFTFQTHFEGVSGAVKHLYDYRLIPKLIVVLIDNYEFGYLTPTMIERDPASGEADLFLRFFMEELFPYLDRSFRTQPYRIVFSNSWGAMFAVYSILARPDVFDAAIASIPWITYDGEARYIINNTKSYLDSNTFNHMLYMTMDDETEPLSDLETFIKILDANPRKGLDWEYHHWPEEDHMSCPYRSVFAGLRRIFQGWNRIPENIAEAGLEEIKKYEMELNRSFGYEIGISPVALRVIGQRFQQKGNIDSAIEVFKYGIQKTPENAFGYVTLGRVYEGAGRWDEAKAAFRTAYQKALSQNHPQVRWVKGFLDRIEKRLEEE